MTHFGRHRSVYSITQSERVRPLYDSPYIKQWTFSHLLNSKLTLTKEWTPPPQPSTEDGLPPQNEITPSGFISDLAFSIDGRYLVAGSTCSDVYLFDPCTTKREIVFKKASQDAITRVCFVRQNKFIVGSANGSLMLWDVRNTKGAITSLVGHTKVIRSIHYNTKEDLLVTSSNDDSVRYWKIAKCEVAAAARAENINTEGYEADPPCDIFLTCPNISLACMNNDCEKFAFITSDGALYVVDNLDLSHLKKDMRRFRFDNSIFLQLSWFTPNSSIKSRNRLRVIGKNDIIPTFPAEITKVNYMGLHRTSPLLLVRMTTMRKTLLSQEKKEWTCAYTLQETANTAALYYSHQCMSSFGSDVIQEKLIYSIEEERYNPLREKRLSFSSCGRIIASPSKKSVRLLSFSKVLDMPFDVKTSMDMFDSPPTTNFNLFSLIEMPENASVCTKFSPRDYLLTVGDINDHVHFFRPVL